MSHLPLQLLFWIDAASIRSGRYRETIGSYHEQLVLRGGFSGCPSTSFPDMPLPHAYVRLTDAEKPLLPDVLDWLYEHDVEPIVEDGAQLRGRTDLLALLERPELQRPDGPFVFVVKGDKRVVSPGQNLRAVLTGAVQTLHSTQAVTSVGFSAAGGQPVNDTFAAVPAATYPAVFRTRDLYLAALLSHGQPAPFMGEADTPAFNILNAFSHHPYRHLAFNRSIAAAA